MKNRRVYLDNNATTPLHPEVKKAVNDSMAIYGNASSLHSFGREAKSMIESARADIASFIMPRQMRLYLLEAVLRQITLY